MLRDPRWQKKRLKILEKNKFQCFECGNTERELHIHHCWYEHQLKPWEYHDSCYLVLCKECHLTRQDLEYKIKTKLADLRIHDLESLCEFLDIAPAIGVDGCVKELIKMMTP
jgi:5-methylcytosine-specific restriction endonuclease McrA